MYISLILLSANINFDMVFHFGQTGVPPFKGIQSFWEQSPIGPPMLNWPHVLLAIVDCLHLSVETLSTVGYGDIVPTTWFAKLAIDVEILLGLGITVVVAGRHFALRSGSQVPR